MPKRADSNVRAPDMRDIVELSNDVVKQFRSDITVLGLDLRREVAKGNDGRLVGSDKDRTNEKFVMGHPFGVAEDKEWQQSSRREQTSS